MATLFELVLVTVAKLVFKHLLALANQHANIFLFSSIDTFFDTSAMETFLKSGQKDLEINIVVPCAFKNFFRTEAIFKPPRTDSTLCCDQVKLLLLNSRLVGENETTNKGLALLIRSLSLALQKCITELFTSKWILNEEETLCE